MINVTEIRCSSLARPMLCAGFLYFKDLLEQEDTPQAMEGTAAAELLDHLISRPDQAPPSQATNGVYFDNDMRFYLMPIAEHIRSTAQGEVHCEKEIEWQTRSGIWIRGRYDASYVRDGKLYIDDLKYGWGIIEAKENWQLLGYAIGEVVRRNQAFGSIVMRIIQPRPHHEDGPIRAWEISYEELLAYRERIEQRMDQIAAGYNVLETGKQCKYCPAAAEACPAFNRVFYRSLEVSTEFVQDKIDDAELARQLDHAYRAAEAIKIKVDSLNELAVSRIKAGKIIPGYITENRYGDRKWKPGISPEVIETLTGKKVVETSMLSPAKAEKAGVPKEVVNALVDRHFLGVKVVKKDAGELGDKIFGTGAPGARV